MLAPPHRSNNRFLPHRLPPKPARRHHVPPPSFTPVHQVIARDWKTLHATYGANGRPHEKPVRSAPLQTAPGEREAQGSRLVIVNRSRRRSRQPTPFPYQWTTTATTTVDDFCGLPLLSTSTISVPCSIFCGFTRYSGGCAPADVAGGENGTFVLTAKTPRTPRKAGCWGHAAERSFAAKERIETQRSPRVFKRLSCALCVLLRQDLNCRIPAREDARPPAGESA